MFKLLDLRLLQSYANSLVRKTYYKEKARIENKRIIQGCLYHDWKNDMGNAV